MKAGRVALILALAAAPALAQTGPGTVPARAPAAGDAWRFRSESHFVQNDDSGRQTQDNVQEFELRVLAVEPDGLKLRYVLQAAELKDSAGASMGALVRAATGEPLDFHVRRDGALSAIDDWTAYRTKLLEKVDAALPAGDSVRTLLHQRMGEAPLETAGEMILGDVKLMAVMEPHGTVRLGRLESGRASTEITVATPGCVLKVSRGDASGATGVGQAVVSEAEVAVEDGRVLTLTEHRVTRASGGTQDETVTIRRLGPIPACATKR